MSAYDEVFKSEYEVQGDKLVRALTQPTENLILERNNELRKNPGMIRDLSFGRWLATIPFNDIEALRRKYPELVHGDAQLVAQTWMKIFHMPEYRKFLVGNKV